MTRLGFDRRLPLVFAATLALLLFNGFLSWWNINRLIENNHQVDHTHEVLGELAELRSALCEAESGQRGHMLTGKSRYIEHHQQALSRIQDGLLQLRQLMADNPRQQARLRQLTPAIAKYLELSESTTLPPVPADTDSARAETQARSDRGQTLIEEVMKSLQPMTEEESTLLKARVQQSRVSARVTLGTLALVTFLAVALLLLLAVVLRLDLKERTRSEAALRKSEQEFRALFDRSGVPKAQADPATGRFLRVNRRFCELIGFTEDELTRLSFSDITHPDDRKTSSAALLRMVLGETAQYASTKRFLRKDGKILWIHSNVTLNTDADGRPKHTLAVFQDVTEQKHAEEALRQSEARFRLLADALPQIVWTTDVDGRLDYCNQRWSEYTGLDLRQTAAGHEAIHPDDRDRVAQLWQQALRTGGIFQTEFRVRRASDGAYRWHLGRSLPIRHPDPLQPGAGGHIVRWFGTSTDIEDQKRAEQAIVQANEDLEHRVAERTAQLQQANEELRQTNLLAQAASRAKSEFLASVSHEIRTPMNGILGMTEMALDTNLSDQQREHLNVVKLSAQALLSLLNDILDFSKIEAGKLELHLAPLALRQELENTLKPFALRAADKGLRYRCTIDPDLPDLFLGDGCRLRQVLLNLVSNAVKFTEQGEVAVRVERMKDEGRSMTEDREACGVLLDSSSFILFSVCDTGIGIPPEQQGAIFEPFVQGDGSLSRKYGGTGLGLSIASRLVEIMGGSLRVKSEVGKGSTFSFAITLATTEQRAPDTPLSQNGTDTPTAASAEQEGAPPLRILLVEDNVFNQQVGAYLLGRSGHQVDIADSGVKALARVQERAYDLVLMDVQMPEMDGLQTTRAIRQREVGTGRKIPIVALTAYASQGDRQRCLEAGMVGHLSKPLNPGQLELLVGQIRTGSLEANGFTEPPADAAPDPNTIFDPVRTLQRLSGNRQLLVEVSKLFADTSGRLLDQLRTALTARDLPALRQAAHTLKGSMCFFSAQTAVEAAQRMEQIGEDLQGAEQELCALSSAVDHLLQAVSQTASFAPSGPQ